MAKIKFTYLDKKNNKLHEVSYDSTRILEEDYFPFDDYPAFEGYTHQERFDAQQRYLRAFTNSISDRIHNKMVWHLIKK